MYRPPNLPFLLLLIVLLLLLLLTQLLLREHTNTFPLSMCGCQRTLPQRLVTKPHFQHTSAIPPSSPSLHPLSSSTCSPDAWHRGDHQRVVAFSLYGSTNSTRSEERRYVEGVEENLSLLPLLYGEGWSMRVYHDASSPSPLLSPLCRLACTSYLLDLCPAPLLPITTEQADMTSLQPYLGNFNFKDENVHFQSK